jgi:hypothetical protein
MPKPTMLKQPVRKQDQQEEDRVEKAPVLVLLAARTGLIRLVGRMGRAGRGYALAGAGVVAAAVVAVSLLSWLAPDSDRPIASPLEAVGRVASGVVEQVDDQVEALLGTYEEKPILRSLREGIAAASSATPWPSGKAIEVAASPSTGPASSSSSAAPTRGGESSSASEGAPSQPASSTPSPSSAGTSEAPTTTTEAPSSSPTAAEPSAPPLSTEEPPPTAEEPSPPPTQEPPAAEEPAPPAEEPPPPSTEEPAPPAASNPPAPPSEGPPGKIANE